MKYQRAGILRKDTDFNLSMNGQKEIVEFFESRGLLINFIETEKSTASSQEAASVIGCRIDEIAKSIVFDVEGKAALILLEGDKKVDIEKLEKTLGSKVKKADPSFIVQKTGFEAGGVAPVVKENMQIFIDKGVMKHEFVWISAGSRTAVIKLDTKGLDKALNAEIISISC